MQILIIQIINGMIKKNITKNVHINRNKNQEITVKKITRKNMKK